jgi:DNA gyrase subunit A
MVQDFSSRYPLVAGHGNFGSVDNDPAAAMRYTETRLSPLGYQGMLSDISEAIVDFTNNFDNSQQEPVVLPAQLPLLLLNGCAGIAVGMATNIPPHNLGEVVDGLIALIDNPQLPDEKLWEIIPGPDFPTGGEILDTTGIKEAYRTGKGLIPLRGVAQLETIHQAKRRNRERTAIIVTELPYQVNKSAWIEKIADLVNHAKLEGIGDLRDESDRTGMRVVIELKKDINPQTVLEQLYTHTALQTNFGVIMLALVENKPCQLSLRQLLDEFLRFREHTLTRQYSHDLQHSQQRLHLLEGLLTALGNLDTVIEILRHAPDGSTAKLRLQEELGISEAQSDSILAMPLRRLTGLERQKLQGEYEDLQGRIQHLQNLLGDRHELLKSLKKDLRSLKRQFGDRRRTRIINTQVVQVDKIDSGDKEDKKIRESKVEEDKEIVTSKKIEREKQKPKPTQELTLSLFTPQIPAKDAVLEITHQGYVSWISLQNSVPQGENGLIYQAPIEQQEQLIVITDTAKAYPIQVQEIPPKGQQLTTLHSLLPKSVQRDEDKVIAQFFLPPDSQPSSLVLLTENARIKRICATELGELSNRGLSLIKFKEQDRLSYVCLTQEGAEVAIATNGGRVLRFPVNDQHLPIMGRSAQGEQALRLRYGEILVGCVCLQQDEQILLVSELGYGKRLPINTLRLARLGDVGNQALQFHSKMDNLAAMVLGKTGMTLGLFTSLERHLSLSMDTIPVWGKDGTGDRIIKLKPQETIVSVVSY